MAKLIINDQEFDVEDGSPIGPFCRDAGVPFNCNTGVCGSCQIEILEGEDNLEDLTLEEKQLALDKFNRLACLCVIKSGTVKITF